MESRWSDRDAEAAIERYTKLGAPLDLALRVYSSRLLGVEPRLVIHGGGNTSVQTVMNDLLGEAVEVLCVKGSGWDMATIEPAGLPAVRLKPLQQLAHVETLSDEEMVRVQRANLLDPGAPNPSVETLLHAFLPHKYIDHTHANAVLALSDQPNGQSLCREVYGESMALVPYVMPGFALASVAVAAFAENPDVEGMILLKHGIFTFGASAREAYERMIDKVTLAEGRIAAAARVSVAGVHLPKAVGRTRPKSFHPIRLPERSATVSQVAPVLRGLAAEARPDRSYARQILEFRSSPAILDFVAGSELARYAQQGTATPDHVIRIKPKPLITPPADTAAFEDFVIGAREAMQAYRTEYQAYFARNNERHAGGKKPLDAVPRVIMVPGLGLFGLGASHGEARIAADLAETNIEVITGAETIGRFEVIDEADLFDIEYWSLEQAKLGKAKESPLARHVAVVTGGASGIGAATAAAFRAAGAELAILDRDEASVQASARQIDALGLACDVTRPEAVQKAFNKIAATYGGVDIVVSNAGAAWQGRIGDVEEQVLRDSFELNFWAHQFVACAAVRVMRAQGIGGCLLFNVSKQAINPGPAFGPYGLPKAATLALMRQYALDYGEDGIRACAVNADRVRSGLLTGTMIAERAEARGVSPQDYMQGNLLGREVTAADVAQAFVSLALARSTTAAIFTVDGGNIAAAPR